MDLPEPAYASPATRLKQKARALGFDACGVARAGALPADGWLDAWLRNERHAGMAWLRDTIETRLDPRYTLPGAASVVVVAKGYYAPRPPVPEGAAQVARYAWGRDYHRVLRQPLRALAAALGEIVPGSACRCFIDTGPVMEKAWAVRAAIGWMGKHGLVIRPGLGSMLFLGVIVTTAHLESDLPMENRCGTCMACMAACPTGAIVEPGRLDATKCLAYHTIESTETVPETLADKLGTRLFGCDACQEACPWNQGLPVTDETSFLPRDGVANLFPEEVLSMDDEAFLRRFAGTPVMRAGRVKLQSTAAAIQAYIAPQKEGPDPA